MSRFAKVSLGTILIALAACFHATVETGLTPSTTVIEKSWASGWIYGLNVGEGLIANGTAETVLVVGSEKMSAIVDWQDRSTCVLFGDGAQVSQWRRQSRDGTQLPDGVCGTPHRRHLHTDGD